MNCFKGFVVIFQRLTEVSWTFNLKYEMPNHFIVVVINIKMNVICFTMT